MVECMNAALPISRQCRLLVLPRSSVYRKLAEVDAEDLAIMALIDRHYLGRPYYGSRRMTAWLATQGHVVNRKRIQRLMRLAGLVTIYQRPNTSKPAVAHKIYPYLLGGISIERVNQVWCADVTYIPMAKGFVYLVVIMDWASRAVLAWRLSNTLGAEFCVEALEEALCRYGRPEIFNTDQSLPSRKRGQPIPPATTSPAPCSATGSRSAWMARAATSTTSSSSGCGAASNTRRSTSTPMPASPRPRPASALGSAFITRSAPAPEPGLSHAAPGLRSTMPVEMWTIGFADRPRLRPHPTGTTTNHRIDIDEARGSSDAMTVAPSAIGA